MTLYDYLKNKTGSLTVRDTIYNIRLSAPIPDEDANTAFDRFCVALYKNLEVKNVSSSGYVYVNLGVLIRQNENLLRDFSNQYWKYDSALDGDRYIQAWFDELSVYLEGCSTDEMYIALIDLLSKLKSVETVTKVFAT